jgi:hypothetical protein
MNRWNISKVEGKPTKFGTGAHICLPLSWLKKDVVIVTKDTWQELHRSVKGREKVDD